MLERAEYTGIILVAILTIGVRVSSALALERSTHDLVNRTASLASQLDPILRDTLGFPEGLSTSLSDRNGSKKRALNWIGEGGIREDGVGGPGGFVLLESRFFRHFHDPLYQADAGGRGPWDQAGLQFLGQNESSIRWMQRQNQDVQAARTGNFSWQDARQYFRTALTSPTPADRDNAFSLTFQALGQIMHLVVDASVPEHVRNDPHPGGLFYGNYEHWVEAQHGISGSPKEQNFINAFLSNLVMFDSAILQQPTNDLVAKVPVARLIDTDTYTGLVSGPNVTRGPNEKSPVAIGIAEIANANFFSEDTGNNQAYPFPDVDRLAPTVHQAPKTSQARAYFKKPADEGLPADPVLAECVLFEPAVGEGIIIDPVIRTCTDDNVWGQVAHHMLPRAVGYARGVLDYFFRGTLDFTMRPVANSQGEHHLVIRNTSNEDMQGTFTLYADDLQDIRQPVDNASFSLSLKAGTSSDPVSFTPPSPVRAYILVFQGELGNEVPVASSDPQFAFPGAVVGKVKQVPVIDRIEPNPAFAGDPATIIGSGFDPTNPANNLISFGGKSLPATAVDASGTHLTFVAPDLPPPGPVTIAGLNPSIPPVEGGSVMITGTNFAGQSAPLRVLVGDTVSNSIEFSTGGATRALVTVLTQFDTFFFLKVGNSATHPIAVTVLGPTTAVATFPPLFDLAPPPNPTAISDFRVGFINLRLKLYDGSRSNIFVLSPFPQVTIEDNVFRPEPPLLRRDPVSIVIGDTVSQAIAAPREIHFFEFPGQEGQQVAITVDGRDGLDAELFISGPGEDSFHFDADDDSGPGLDAVLPTVTLPATGIYTIEVRSSTDTGSRTTGPYILTLEEVIPPPGQ